MPTFTSFKGIKSEHTNIKCTFKYIFILIYLFRFKLNMNTGYSFNYCYLIPPVFLFIYSHINFIDILTLFLNFFVGNCIFFLFLPFLLFLNEMIPLL